MTLGVAIQTKEDLEAAEVDGPKAKVEAKVEQDPCAKYEYETQRALCEFANQYPSIKAPAADSAFSIYASSVIISASAVCLAIL